MKYHTSFFSKIRNGVAKLSSAAVVIGALGLIIECFIYTSQIIRHNVESSRPHVENFPRWYTLTCVSS